MGAGQAVFCITFFPTIFLQFRPKKVLEKKGTKGWLNAGKKPPLGLDAEDFRPS